MHPLWQIRQVVSFHSKRYVDRCNVVGGDASQHIWHAFMSLVTWIAVIKYLIYLLYLYVDDSFSAQKRGALEALLQALSKGAALHPHLTSPAMGLH